MVVVGELFLAAFLQVLFERLASRELLNFARKEGLQNALKKWRRKLLQIQAVVNDAEDRQVRDPAVKMWLDDLRDLAYDVDDLLDEFATEALRHKFMAEPHASTSKIRTLVPSCFTSFSPDAIMFSVRMGSKIKEITSRFQDIAKQKIDLGLRECEGDQRYNRVMRQRLPSTSLVDECRVYGREKDKEAMVELLLRNVPCDGNQVCVIPILGMGGIGKTTLAQLVYNDEKVKGRFDLRAWACVSEEFDVVRVTKTILQSITSGTCDVKDLNLLQVRLKEELMTRTFLIVLDDVWNENYSDWDVLCSPLRVGAPGSKIIVTTRNAGVVSIMRTVPAYHLMELSNDDCLSLFMQHACGMGNVSMDRKLKLIGDEIVKKCKGLPLAAKTLGGLLRNKLNSQEWEDVLNSKIWDFPEQNCSILPALRLSYHHLPPLLKQCFAYCAIFPKGYEFDKDELVQLWMALGFLRQPKGNKGMEDLGLECFQALLSRSFFQQSSGTEPKFAMHDLINDLAQFVAGEICFRVEDEFKGSDGKDNNPEKARYSSYIRGTSEVSIKFETFKKMKFLRTFLALPIQTSYSRHCYLSFKVLHDLLPRLRCLRVLSLSGYCITELPNSVGDLKHLRYLNLSCTLIKWLPESLSYLYNLQTLILHGCMDLMKLPAGLANLINLRHLDLTGTHKLQEMPLCIGNLTSLHKLSKFIVGKVSGVRMTELRDLKHLRGELSISGLHNVLDIRDAKDASLEDKHYLDELVVKWNSNFDDLRNDSHELHVLSMLQPHKNLKKLSIAFYGGTKCPSWIGDRSFSQIVHLNLSNCRKLTSLPSLGQLPSLKNLCIRGAIRVKRVGVEFYGNGSHFVKYFPSLKTLTFSGMLEWEDWSSSTVVEETDGGAFSCLSELYIKNCPNLIKRLPNYLPSLVKLDICRCPQLEGSLPRLPTLCELYLEECNGQVMRSVIKLTSVTTLQIRRISQLTNLTEGFMQCLTALKVLNISDCKELTSLCQNEAEFQNLTCLERLVVEDCPLLTSLVEEEQEMHCNLQYLEIYNCHNLGKLPNGLHNFTSLQDLRIQQCPKLVSFPELGLPSMLKRLVISECEALESLPDGMMVDGDNKDVCLLQYLKIRRCHSLICFPKGELPTTLKQLEIQECRNLQSLPDGILWNNNGDNSSKNNNALLEHLVIEGCSSLANFPEGQLLASLKLLRIRDCTQLESLTENKFQNNMSLEFFSIWKYTNLRTLPMCLLNFTNLTELHISDCAGLESFPERGFLTPSLTGLYIYDCVNLKSLPYQMQNLTNLQHLRLSNCPGLASLTAVDFPANLIQLEIKDCENLKSLSEWGLQRLNSLQYFTIVGGFQELVFFSDECLLPAGLASLCIERLLNLESLSSGLQNLTSLEELCIEKCHKLQSLSEKELPATLSKLIISNCSVLKRRCLKDKGADWRKIAHIPWVMIDGLSVHQQVSN